jgi:hypothetical protein
VHAFTTHEERPSAVCLGPLIRIYLVAGQDLNLAVGDARFTVEGEDLVLSFIDTDNYTPAKAALDVVRERTWPARGTTRRVSRQPSM